MSLINNHFKTFLITSLSLTLLFLISCSNEGTTGGGTGGGAETTETIDAKDFPPELLGTYRDERLPNDDKFRNAKVSLSGLEIWIRGYEMRHKKDGSNDGIQVMDWRMKEWKKTTKGEKIIKVEGESLSTRFNEKNEKITIAKTTITYDYESKTVSVIYTTYTPDGVDASFYGKKIN